MSKHHDVLEREIFCVLEIKGFYVHIMYSANAMVLIKILVKQVFYQHGLKGHSGEEAITPKATQKNVFRDIFSEKIFFNLMKHFKVYIFQTSIFSPAIKIHIPGFFLSLCKTCKHFNVNLQQLASGVELKAKLFFGSCQSCC